MLLGQILPDTPILILLEARSILQHMSCHPERREGSASAFAAKPRPPARQAPKTTAPGSLRTPLLWFWFDLEGDLQSHLGIERFAGADARSAIKVADGVIKLKCAAGCRIRIVESVATA